MYKKISLFALFSLLTVSATFAVVPAPITCNVANCSVPAMCSNMSYYINNGCANCTNLVNGRILTTCNTNYANAVMASNINAMLQKMVAICVINGTKTPNVPPAPGCTAPNPTQAMAAACVANPAAVGCPPAGS